MLQDFSIAHFSTAMKLRHFQGPGDADDLALEARAGLFLGLDVGGEEGRLFGQQFGQLLGPSPDLPVIAAIDLLDARLVGGDFVDEERACPGELGERRSAVRDSRRRRKGPLPAGRRRRSRSTRPASDRPASGVRSPRGRRGPVRRSENDRVVVRHAVDGHPEVLRIETATARDAAPFRWSFPCRAGQRPTRPSVRRRAAGARIGSSRWPRPGC